MASLGVHKGPRHHKPQRALQTPLIGSDHASSSMSHFKTVTNVNRPILLYVFKARSGSHGAGSRRQEDVVAALPAYEAARMPDVKALVKLVQVSESVALVIMSN